MSRKVEALAESVFGVYGNDEYRLAEKFLASPWLAAHVDAAQAEERKAALAEVRALADLLDGMSEVVPYIDGDDVSHYCGKVCREATHHVRVSNHNDPKQRLAVFCTTPGCMAMPKVSDLRKRYRVTEWEFTEAAKRVVRRLRASLPATESREGDTTQGRERR